VIPAEASATLGPSETPLSTLSPSIMPSAVPTIRLTPTLPAYFKPHPALMRLEEWETLHGKWVTPTATPNLPTTDLPDLTQKPEFSEGIVELIWSHDKEKILVIANASTSSAPIILGDTTGLTEDFPFKHQQGWIVTNDVTDIKPVYYTDLYWGIEWADNKHLIIYSFCYGLANNTSGLNILNIETLDLQVIYDHYGGNCEGGLPFSTSPDGKYLAYRTGLINVSDGKITSVCPADEYARSYTWSSDSSNVYFSCTSAKEQSDELHRFNVNIGKGEILTNRTEITFKANKMWLTNDNQYIVFEWGNSHYVDNIELYGMWVLELTKFNR
jgi:hypothetical protein